MCSKLSGAMCLAAVAFLFAHAAPAAGGEAVVEGNPKGLVELEGVFLRQSNETTAPLGARPGGGATPRRAGELPGWIVGMLGTRPWDWRPVDWDMGVPQAGAMWNVSFPLQDGRRVVSAPSLSLEFGQEGHLTLWTVIDYIRTYRYAEGGGIEPTSDSVTEGRDLHYQVWGSDDPDSLVIRSASEQTSVDLDRVIRLEPVVHAGARRGKRVLTMINQPVVPRLSIETTVRATQSDGAVVGGLASLESRRCRRGVPLLRSIPLVGSVFGRRGVRHTASRYCEAVRPRVLSAPAEPQEPRFPGARQVLVRLRIARFVAEEDGALPAAVARLPKDWLVVGGRLKAPYVLLDEAETVAAHLLAAAPGVVSQREVAVIALEGAPFEACLETEHTYLDAFTLDVAERPVPDVRELTDGMSLAGTAQVRDNGAIAVKAELRVARLDGFAQKALEVPSGRSDGTPGPPHRLQIDVPRFAEARLAIDEALAPGETCVLDVHGTPPGSAAPQVSIYMLTADVLEDEVAAEAVEQVATVDG